MGNVQAFSEPSVSPASGDHDILKSIIPNEINKVDDWKFNPGNFEEIHRKCKEIFPVTFEGVRLMINKGLSNHFQISHTLSISNLTSGYRFGATYVGKTQYSPTEAYPVLLGDIDVNGNLNAQIIHQPAANIRYKLLSQIQNNKLLANQFSVDYKSKNHTASFTLSPNMSQNIFSSPNILSSLFSGIIVAQYLQNLTPKLALGTELMYHKSPDSVGSSFASPFGVSLGSLPKHNAVMTVGGKYTGSDFVASATFGSAGWKASYWQNLNSSPLLLKSDSFLNPSSDSIIPQSFHYDEKSSVQVGCEVETNPTFGESVATFGYQVTLKETITSSIYPHHLMGGGGGGQMPPGNIPYVFRGYIDTNGTLGATLEKKLHPLPLTFTLSGALNHGKGMSKFGIGLMLG